jgi:hypothetical protein
MGLIDSVSLNAFNLGIATAGPFFYELVISDYLKEIKRKPKFVFLLVSPISFSNKADNFVAYPIHRYLNSPYSNELLVLKYNCFQVYLELLHKSFKKGFENLLNYGNSSKQLPNSCDKLQVSKGFIASDSVNTEKVVQRTEHLYKNMADEAFDEAKAQYLLRIADSLNNQQIKVIFYTLPTNSLFIYFNKKFLDSYSAFVAKLQTNYSFITTDLPEDDKYFRNIDHLNSLGAEAVTSELLEKFLNGVSKRQ